MSSNKRSRLPRPVTSQTPRRKDINRSVETPMNVVRTAAATGSATDFRAVLRHNNKLLSQCLVVSHELLFEIESVDYMRDKVPHIRKQVTDSQKVAELLRIIGEVPDNEQQSVFHSLLSALREDGQEHVANIFIPQSEDRPMTREHRQMLISKKDELSQFINPTCMLLNRLEAKGVFNERRDRENVASKSSYTEMSTQLIDCLLRKPDSSFDGFIEALHYTEQQHVVHILTGQGESPLSYLRRLVLRKAHKKLIGGLNPMHTPLLSQLISSGVLTDADKQRIEAHGINEGRTAELIDVIARKSQIGYDKFIQALKDSGHRRVAELLEGLELRGRIDPEFLSTTPLPDRKEVVQLVKNNMTTLVSGTGDDVKTLTSLMEQNGFAVSAIQDGSILICFRCFTEESLENLRQLYSDKTLDKLLTQVFCPQFAVQGLVSLTLHITDSEFQIAETLRKTKLFERSQTKSSKGRVNVSMFTKMSRWMHFRSHHQERFSSLPLELMDLVLLRTFILLFISYRYYKSHYRTHQAVLLAFNRMAAVCYNWWKSMNGWPQSRHFKYKLHRSLNVACRPFDVFPRPRCCLETFRHVEGVTQCENKLFTVSYQCNAVCVFGPENQVLAVLELKELCNPTDIASCAETRHLYIAGESRPGRGPDCVWRVSFDIDEIMVWLSNQPTANSNFRPWTLSVTSRRLLVTSQVNNELLLYGADGGQLRCVSLTDLKTLQHAVETSRGTFIVSHLKPKPRVCEVNGDGHVISVYSDQVKLSKPVYLSLDSVGRIFVADWQNHCVLLLNSRMQLERVLLDRQEHRIACNPWRLCYTEQTGQLVVAGRELDGRTLNWNGRMHLFMLHSLSDLRTAHAKQLTLH